MAVGIPVPPNAFGLAPHANRWFSWDHVGKCFWPRASGYRTSKHADPVLAPMTTQGGVYLLAWNIGTPPVPPHPTAPSVCYIGETNNFKTRMGGFGNSAGLWGKRYRGHSAGWRWPLGRWEHLWVAFFVVDWPLDQPHLGEGMRKWLEAVGLEEHRQEHGLVPLINNCEDAQADLPFRLQCTSRTGSTRIFHVEHVPGSGPDASYHVHVRWPANPAQDDFFQLTVRREKAVHRVVAIEHNGRLHYSGAGIPDALLPLVAEHLGTSLVSSSNRSGDGEFRTGAATKAWERLRGAGKALYDVDLDRYSLLVPAITEP